MLGARPVEIMIRHNHNRAEGHVKMSDTQPLALEQPLRLSHNEEQLLARLVRQGCLSREQVCGIAMRANRPVAIGSVNTMVAGLRRKLRAFGIELVGMSGFGWELRRENREKIRELLARATPGRAAGDPLEPLRRPPVSFSG